jgi:hypothetical protein
MALRLLKDPLVSASSLENERIGKRHEVECERPRAHEQADLATADLEKQALCRIAATSSGESCLPQTPANGRHIEV